jgi:putative phage-type endonuclease
VSFTEEPGGYRFEEESASMFDDDETPISADDREAWLEARKRYVTGSDIAALLGESKYKTRGQLLMEKAGLADEWKGSEQTDIGLDLEPAIAQIAARRWGWKLERVAQLIVDPECSFHASTPDYVVTSPFGHALVQIKMTTAQAQEDCKPRKNGAPSEAAFANGVPLYHQLQLQSEMACTGLSWGAVLVLHTSAPNFKLRAYPVRRHEAVIARIRNEVKDFMAELEMLKAGENRKTA